jgi:hypothetical protein
MRSDDRPAPLTTGGGHQGEITAMHDLPDDDRRALEREVETPATEAMRPEAPKDQVGGRLERIKDRLAGLDGVAAGALSLAKAVAGIAALIAAL